MALKDRLKDSRIKAKKTQAEVAEAVKMSQPAYQALESGKNLKSAFLPLIAQFLGCLL
ncbi:helix-turn-helix domain-containing protein, partial [Acinetobacter baumannii]